MSVTIKYPDLIGLCSIEDTTPVYNSIAWAMDDTTRFWDPHEWLGGTWRGNRNRAEITKVEAVENLFLSYGYRPSNSTQYVPGLRKIVIYVQTIVVQNPFCPWIQEETDELSYVSVLKKGTLWSTKLDKCELIAHNTPEDVETTNNRRGIGIILLRSIFEREES